jgi:hypothetical protein
MLIYQLERSSHETNTTQDIGCEVRYAMIDKLRHQHPVSKLCDLLDVAKSGYQAWSTGKVTTPPKARRFTFSHRYQSSA